MAAPPPQFWKMSAPSHHLRRVTDLTPTGPLGWSFHSFPERGCPLPWRWETDIPLPSTPGMISGFLHQRQACSPFPWPLMMGPTTLSPMGCLLPLLSLGQDLSATIGQREITGFVPSGLLRWPLHPFCPQSWQPSPTAHGRQVTLSLLALGIVLLPFSKNSTAPTWMNPLRWHPFPLWSQRISVPSS